MITGYAIIDYLIGSLFTQLDKTFARNHDELLPLGVVPVLALGDAWFADVDGDLTAIQCMNQFRKATSVVHIHLQVEDGLLLGEIREVGAVEALCERVGRNLGNHESTRHFLELMKEVNDFAKGYLVGHWAETISAG